jgi:glycosyltransferase involved in cell wall biosynthesis
MKIGINFHTFDSYISGVEYYTLGMINAFLSIDNHNDYFVFTNQPNIVKQYVHLAENLAIVEVLQLKTRLRRIIWEHTRLPSIAVRLGLDILHFPHYICSLRQSSVPYVLTIHDTIAIDSPEWCKSSNAAYYNLCMKAALKRAEAIIAVSKCTASDLQRNFSLSSSKVKVVYPGIDPIFSCQVDYSSFSDVRTCYNLPERYILYVGNIEPKKNVKTLLYVYQKLKKRGLSHKLVLVGKRSWKVKAELDKITKGVASNDIILAGYVDRNDLPFVYRMADVFVFLSLYEGFGFPSLEAMACGTPVVSSAKGALAETAAGAAITVEPDNVDEITNAVLKILTNRSTREKYIRLGKERSRLFDWNQTAVGLLDIYSDVINKLG